MATRVSRALPRVNYPTTQRVAAHVALALGMTEGSTKQILYGRDRLNRRVAVVIEALIRSGDRAALAHFLAPIEAAVQGIPAPTETDELAEQAQTADGDEDTLGTAYDRNPCEATAKPYVLALDTDRALNLELRQAIAARWGLK